MNMVNYVLKTKHPAKVVDFTFVTFFIFMTIVCFAQLNTLISGYRNSAADEIERVHANIIERKTTQVNRVLFLEEYFTHVYNQDISSSDDADFRRALDNASANLSYIFRQKIGNNHDVIINIINNELLRVLSGTQERRYDNDNLIREMNAIQHLFTLLPFTDRNGSIESRIYYISKSGLYSTSTSNLEFASGTYSIDDIYKAMVRSPYFYNAIKLSEMPKKTMFTAIYESFGQEGKLTTMSIPVIIDGRVIGVLCFDFTLDKIQHLFKRAISFPNARNYYWIDGRKGVIASNLATGSVGDISPRLFERVMESAKQDNQGSFWFGMNFVTYTQLRDADAVFFSTQSPYQMLKGKFGTPFTLITSLWVIFIFTMLFSYIFIRKLINQMHSTQIALAWRANNDSLTNVLNRNGFFNAIHKSIIKCKKLRLPVSVIQIDLDNFKKINDTFGHSAGDSVLVYAADIIKKNVRKGDLVGRIGGEEFCIFVPGLDIERCALMAERIRHSLAASRIDIDSNSTLSITASMGVACSTEIDSYEINKIQAIGDRRLYMAKAAGRNRVCAEDASSA